MLHADPFELVSAAAAGGFDRCGIRIVSPDPGRPVFDLIEDRAMRSRFVEHMKNNGVEILDFEAVWLRSDTDVNTLIPALEAAADMGSKYVLTVGNDFEIPRLTDTFGRLADAADRFGLILPLEFITYSAVSNLAAAVDLAAQVGRSNVGIVIDSLQFFRAGAEWDVLAQIPRSRLPYIQISDGPIVGPTDIDTLRYEARTSRMAPGAGELDLRKLLQELPSNIPISIEIPNPELARLPFDEAAMQLREATDRLLDSL
ncbi:sugar phosphate isomerase/epimerase [Nocardia sp. NPDC050799]|uniref:sugar phosphate isomerase/epimerase family protein n=1 Tax=Nocardia sp. NPDC050799 TaxID=3154842 RepID=UPI00340DA245